MRPPVLVGQRLDQIQKSNRLARQARQRHSPCACRAVGYITGYWVALRLPHISKNHKIKSKFNVLLCIKIIKIVYKKNIKGSSSNPRHSPYYYLEHLEVINLRSASVTVNVTVNLSLSLSLLHLLHHTREMPHTRRHMHTRTSIYTIAHRYG